MTEITDQALKEMLIVAEQEAMRFCGFTGHTEYSRIRNRRFAELIAQESIDTLMKLSYELTHPEELSEYNQGWVNSRILGVEHIKERFGLK